LPGLTVYIVFCLHLLRHAGSDFLQLDDTIKRVAVSTCDIARDH